MILFYVLVTILALVSIFGVGVLLAILLYNYNATFRRWVNYWADNTNYHNHKQ